MTTAAYTAEEFWSGQLVPQEDVQRLNELYPVKRSPGESVPPDEVSHNDAIVIHGHCSHHSLRCTVGTFGFG